MKLIRQSVARLHAYTPGEQPRDRGVIKLNTNENPYPPSPKVAAALAAFAPARLRLYPQPVAAKLRARIARIHGCRPAQVFVGNGSDEILALCARAFVERNGAIGYFDPSYSLYPVLAAIEDVRAKPVPLDEQFQWSMPPDYQAALFYLTDPNAPTSLLHDPQPVRAFCRRFRGVVLIDEAYADFARQHCLDLALSRPNVLVARTLSKSFSLAGLRVGYAIGSVPLIEALHKIKDSYNVSMLSQELALAALSDLTHMRSNVQRIVRTRQRVARELVGLGFEVLSSATNFLWARPCGCSARKLFEELRRRKIFIRYFPGRATGRHVRITIGTDAQMDAFLRALRMVLGKIRK